MTTDEMGKIEEMIRARFRAHRPDVQTLTTALAVLGLICSVVYSWAVTEQRVLRVESTTRELSVQAKQVPELRWEIGQLKRDLDRLDSRSLKMEKQVSEIHEAIIRMGVRIDGPGPSG